MRHRAIHIAAFAFALRLLLCGLPAFCLSALNAQDGDADADSRFDTANSKYEAGDFAGAATAYQVLVNSEAFSEEVFFNLGNAHYRLGDLGTAALFYHRSLVLDPGMAEARQNLKVINNQTGALIIENQGLNQWIAAVHPSVFVFTSALFFWLSLLSVVIAGCVRRSRPWLPAILITAFLSAGLVAASMYAEGVWRDVLSSDNYAVVTASEISARVNAVPDAAEVIALPPGSVVRILERRGPWRFVEIPGNFLGWIHSDHAQQVWPLSP